MLRVYRRKVSEEIEKTMAQTDISEIAKISNKILSQFENFSNYTKWKCRNSLTRSSKETFK